MDTYEKLYVDSLAEVKALAPAFADALLRACAAAQLYDPRNEKPAHPEAEATFNVCRGRFVKAFADNPGLAQLFFGGGGAQ